MPGETLRGVGSKYEPTFNPRPPLLSLAKAAATDAQQRQHSWSACKRKGDTASDGALRGWRPCHPLSARPRRAPALATRPSPAGPHGGPGRAAGRAQASRRAHSMVRGGRGGCGRRAFSPPPRSAALQVRRQVGAAAAHIAGRARRPPRLRPPARPSFCGAPACELPPAAPRGARGLPGPGLRASERTGPGALSLPARRRPPVCAAVGGRARVCGSGAAAPAGSPARRASARLSSAR